MSEYLAIKNWDKYQPKDSKTLPWIRDYKDKETDRDYHHLTITQRYMLDAICRLRGKYGRDLPNDTLWICRATAVIPRERHNATTAVQQLITYGFLIVHNQQDAKSSDLGKERLVEVRKGKERKTSSRSASTETVFDEAYAQYPRHVGKRAAEKAWSSALGRSENPPVKQAEFIYQRVMTFAAVCERTHKPREYIPHMATWLNQDRFMDDPTEWAVSNGNGSTYVNKGQQRQDASNDAIRTALSRLTGQSVGESESCLPLPGHDDRDGRNLFAGDGSAGRGGGKAQIFSDHHELPARVQNVPVNRGDARESAARISKAPHGSG